MLLDDSEELRIAPSPIVAETKKRFFASLSEINVEAKKHIEAKRMPRKTGAGKDNVKFIFKNMFFFMASGTRN
jgi:hypothetical protein